jgi:hypothetical protein
MNAPDPKEAIDSLVKMLREAIATLTSGPKGIPHPSLVAVLPLAWSFPLPALVLHQIGLLEKELSKEKAQAQWAAGIAFLPGGGRRAEMKTGRDFWRTRQEKWKEKVGGSVAMARVAGMRRNIRSGSLWHIVQEGTIRRLGESASDELFARYYDTALEAVGTCADLSIQENYAAGFQDARPVDELMYRLGELADFVAGQAAIAPQVVAGVAAEGVSLDEWMRATEICVAVGYGRDAKDNPDRLKVKRLKSEISQAKDLEWKVIEEKRYCRVSQAKNWAIAKGYCELLDWDFQRVLDDRHKKEEKRGKGRQ